VAGDPEAARVGVAVAVDEQKVRLRFDAFEGEGEGWYLAEGEEAGDVGKVTGASMTWCSTTSSAG
jgi:hypothetical protein